MLLRSMARAHTPRSAVKNSATAGKIWPDAVCLRCIKGPLLLFVLLVQHRAGALQPDRDSTEHHAQDGLERVFDSHRDGQIREIDARGPYFGGLGNRSADRDLGLLKVHGGGSPHGG